MIDNYEEEILIKNRLVFKENSIKKLASKYYDLLGKCTSKEAERKDFKQDILTIIKDIVSELDNIEIALWKAENYEKLKERDIKNHNRSCDNIENEGKLIKKETEELNNKLNQAKKEKDFKNTCEEIGKVINSYSPHTELNNKINLIENENKKIISSQNAIMNKIGMESKKLSLLLKIVNDLKTNLSNLKTSQDELMEF